MSVVKLRIGPADHGRPMTLEEFREAEEQPGYLYELARGVLEVSEVPSDDHGHVIDNLHEMISLYRRGHPGRISRIAHGSDIRLLIPELESDRHPDLAIVFRGAPLNARGRQIPRWISEVVSPGAKARRRDYEVKSEEYLALNIGEYWIIDPFERKVTVRVRQETPEGPIWSERVFTGEEVIVSELLPGFQGTVAELWADAEPGPEGGDGE
jgi:Uma2 family endonuclease